MPSKEENARNGLPETDWRDAQYDMLYLPVTETVRYHYDFNGNRTATVLPDGRQINYLYYGSGHLHQISLDDEVITDIERDKLHREIYRTQGKLASRYELDPLGRLKRQIATLNDLTEGGKSKTKVAAGYGQTAVKRSYGYDRTGNLTHSTDRRTGTTRFEYDKLGRITQAGNELFAFDPAHNILSDGLNAVTDNRLKTYNGSSYYYDHFGNLIHRELADGEVQNYFYDLHDQLVKAEIFKKDGTKETWSYTYDALGRRIGKGRLKNEEVSDNLEEETGFVWDGSHLLQEVHSDASVLAKTGKAASTTVQTVGKVVNYADDANDIAHTVTAMQDDPLGAALQFGIGRAIGHGSNVLGNKARARFGKGGSGADVDLPSSGKGVDLPAGNAGLKTHADTDVDPSTLGTGKKPKPEIQTPQHQEIPSPSKKPELDVTKTSKPEIDRASSPAVDKTNSKPSEIDTGKTVKPKVSQARPSEVASPNSRPKEVDVTKKPDIEASRPAEVNPTKIKPEMETKVKPDIDAAAASASAVPKVKAQEPDLPKAGQPEVTPDAGKKVQKPEEVDTEATKAGKVEEIGDADKKVKPKPKIIDGKEYITFRRVQGGGSGTATSQERIGITEDGQIIINKKDKNLNISINNGEHAAYYLDNRRTGGDVVEFEVPKWFYDFSDKYTISQVGYKKNPDNQGGMAPKETDLDTEGRSYEMPAPWSEWIEEHAINGRIIEGNEWKKMMGFNNKGGGS